ncbi:hypothetical protein B0H17DRAFT_1333920 [Mycena rosella]|uniref:Uncharacterized protein n=1 Tax=Mycena rosella TaxID=1033263 RepID=A0AAD7G954_MYCRO|nr:hypothetical protein B0H17DRAFT_1333920 [Mycena rosella]
MVLCCRPRCARLGFLLLLFVFLTLTTAHPKLRHITGVQCTYHVAATVGGPPQCTALHEWEAALSQKKLSLPVHEGMTGCYVYFSNQVQGLGWNNCFNKVLMNAPLAYISGHAYLFQDLYWSHEHSSGPRNSTSASPSGRARPSRDRRRPFDEADPDRAPSPRTGSTSSAPAINGPALGPVRGIVIVPARADEDAFPQTFELALWDSPRFLPLLPALAASPISRATRTFSSPAPMHCVVLQLESYPRQLRSGVRRHRARRTRITWSCLEFRGAAQCASHLDKRVHRVARADGWAASDVGMAMDMEIARQAAVFVGDGVPLRAILSTTARSGQFRAIRYDKHIWTVGNKLADEATKEASERDPDPGNFVSFTSVRRLIHLRILGEWDARWRTTKVGSTLRYLDKSPPSLIPIRLYSSSTLSRKSSSSLSQLRTGFSHLNADRFRTGLIDSPTCEDCGAPYETRAHFILECPVWEPLCQPLHLASRELGHFGSLHLSPLLTHPKLLTCMSKFMEVTRRFARPSPPS